MSDVESESAESADERRHIMPPPGAWWSESEPAAASSSSEAERRERRAAIADGGGWEGEGEGVKDRRPCSRWCALLLGLHVNTTGTT
eukprot:COSAG04_NODE_2303_length_4361_cov_2.065228_3_plen_87_part_00